MKKVNDFLKNFKTSQKNSFNMFALAFLITSPLIIFFLYILLPQGPNDWTKVFYAVSKIPFTPYQNSLYINPPWMALFLSPFGLFSSQLARALNAFFALFFISLLVLQSKGNGWSFLMTFTSFPFVGLLANGTIDWIVAAGLVFGSLWGIPFLLAKPQTGAFVVLLWFKKTENKKLFFLVFLIFIGLSFIIWRFWPQQMIANVRATPLGDWNASLFPWSIPLGIYLSYLSLKYEDTLAAIGAGLCFTPYFALHSLIVGFAVLSGRYRKATLFLWIILWFRHFYF